MRSAWHGAHTSGRGQENKGATQVLKEHFSQISQFSHHYVFQNLCMTLSSSEYLLLSCAEEKNRTGLT